LDTKTRAEPHCMCYASKCSDHHPDYDYWLNQQGETVRIIHGAFRGNTGRIKSWTWWAAEVQVTHNLILTVVYDDLRVVTRPSYWHGKKDYDYCCQIHQSCWCVCRCKC